MRYKILGSVTEAISIAEARAHCYLETAVGADEDAQETMVPIYLAAAREMAENFTGLALGVKTIEMALDVFNDDIELVSPVREILSVKYYDEDGVLQTLDPSTYYTDTYSKPSYLIVNDGYSWPSVQNKANAVIITYEAGYGSDTDHEILPFCAKAAILLTVGKLFENREDATEKPMSNLPEGAFELLRPLRVRLGIA
jgi:uncharacterized phiE125 gp8 family phage protein